MSDDEIISNIAAGSISAFEELYRATYKQVFAFILSITKCRHTAEDLMQDTYMRIFEKAMQYQKGSNMKTWIMTIAKNITYDYFRKMKNILPLDEEILENDITGICGIETILDHVVLTKALKKLSGVNAEIAVLYAVCGFKHKEIAEILSIPEGTVRRRYREAIKILADELSNEETKFPSLIKGAASYGQNRHVNKKTSKNKIIKYCSHKEVMKQNGTDGMHDVQLKNIELEEGYND